MQAFGGPMERSERWGLVLGLLLAAGLMWPLRLSITDTTFVWLRYAQHLAHGNGLVFNLGERVYACTNPLWLALLADAIGCGLDGLTFAKVVGGLSALLTVPLFLQLMRRTVRTPVVRAVATVAWAGQAWMAQWSLSGLETPLATALVLAGFVALTEGPEWGARPVRTGALWALAALTRPGVVLLLLLWGTALLVDAQNRPGLRRLLYGMAPPVAIYGGWLLFTRLYFGSFWPRVLSLSPANNPSMAEWGQRFMGQLSGVATTEGVLLAAAGVALILRRSGHAAHDRSALRLLPFAWVLLLPSLFAARGVGISPRYLLIVIPVLQWLCWRAIDRWWGRETPSAAARARTAVLSLALAALVVIQNVAIYRDRVLPEVRSDSAAMARSLVTWGRWLRTHAPRRTVVASFECGALGYWGDVRVIDLTGLLTPHIPDATRGLSDREVVSRLAFGRVSRADYVVDRGVSAQALLEATPWPAAFKLLDEAGGYAFYRLRWEAAEDSTQTPR